MHIIWMLNEVPEDADQIYGDDNMKNDVSKFDKITYFHAKHTFWKICN